MQDGEDRSSWELTKKSCYILDHAAVANEGLSFLVAPDVRIKYVGTRYIDNPEKNWGKDSGKWIILHIRTLKGFGHFRLMDYDPYAPTLEYDKIISIRYYDVKGEEQ